MLENLSPDTNCVIIGGSGGCHDTGDDKVGIMSSYRFQRLKRKYRDVDELAATGYTGSCHFDNFRCIHLQQILLYCRC